MGLLCEKLCDQCFRHDVVGARLWSDGMFAERDLIIKNSDSNSVQGECMNTQLVWEEFIYRKNVS